MLKSNNKRVSILILSILVLLLILIAILSGFIIYLNKYSGLKRTNTSNLSSSVKETVGKNKYYFSEKQVQSALNKISNKSLSDSERYKGLSNLAFYFAVAYSASHNPALRDYVVSLNKYGKENFPKDYNAPDFDVSCSDPDCGEKPDDEFYKIEKEIRESGIKPLYEDTIIKNFEIAYYTPIKDIENKNVVLTITINQLKSLGDPEASSAAKHIINYAKKKYSLNL
jgi:hypothetical protein